MKAYEVLTEAARWTWSGWHQRVRITLEALLRSTFPQDMRTFRRSRAVHQTIGALMGVNSILYMVRFPQSQRARSLNALLPAKERRGLKAKEHTKEWGSIEKVERIERDSDITFYVLEGDTRGFMRHELLKVEAAAQQAPEPSAPTQPVRRRLLSKQRPL